MGTEVTVQQVKDKIYGGNTSKSECVEIMETLHDRFADYFYEFAPQGSDEAALKAIKSAIDAVKNSTLQ